MNKILRDFGILLTTLLVAPGGLFLKEGLSSRMPTAAISVLVGSTFLCLALIALLFSVKSHISHRALERSFGVSKTDGDQDA